MNGDRPASRKAVFPNRLPLSLFFGMTGTGTGIMSRIERYLSEKAQLEKDREERRRANGWDGELKDEKAKGEWLQAELEFGKRRQELRKRYFPDAFARWEPRGELEVPEIHTAADLWCIIEETLLPKYEGASRIVGTGNFDPPINKDLRLVCKVLLHRLNITWGPELSDKPLEGQKGLDELKKIAIGLRKAAETEILGEQTDLDHIRGVLKQLKNGANSKTKEVLSATEISRQRTLDALRELQRLGEYHGHAHASKKKGR